MTEYLDKEVVCFVCYEGSWGATPRVETTMKITAWVDEERSRGGFEIYDTETGGDEFYGGGGLWLNDNGLLYDYDGTSNLDVEIVRWLDSLGHIDTDERCYFRELITPKKKWEMKTTRESEE